MSRKKKIRRLVLILGDQLNRDSAVFDEFDSEQDLVWMAEVEHEIERVWSHQTRIVLFLSAMRHFRDEMKADGLPVIYHQLFSNPDRERGSTFSEILADDLRQWDPDQVTVVQPGDEAVMTSLSQTVKSSGRHLEVLEDRHFFISPDDFRKYASGRKSLRLEFFYRELRKRTGVLMDQDGKPIGGKWNFDHENRESFGKGGPGGIPGCDRPALDDTTREVMELVRSRFGSHPGRIDQFDWPVTRKQGLRRLDFFVEHLLPHFGEFEDAMWTDEPTLFHSRLSVPLNLKLISPRECVDRALEAYKTGHAPLNSVEGFIRQVLGWREFIRGVYWLLMPEYGNRNHLDQLAELPSFFWDGETEMNCVRQSMKHVLDLAYSHHIHRLMVLGNLSLLLGVHPHRFHEWHMAMYADAVDWVSLPNTLGMSQFGDGGVVGTKPYCCSGNYINKMSNFCSNCRFDHRQRTGPDACPVTTLYWDFLDRQSDRLKDNQRMKFAFKNLDRMRADSESFGELRWQAEQLRKDWDVHPQDS